MKIPVFSAFLASALIIGSGISPAAPKTPYTLPDGSWITIDGKVIAVAKDAFELDYGKGAIIVEMDDYDWYPEGTDILKNDRVVVTGRIDADQGEKRSIEAGSVYVKGAEVSFFANAEDEEGNRSGQKMSTADSSPDFSFYGTVTGINDRDFTLDTGYQIVTVNTTQLGEDAFDDEGDVQVALGDRVAVRGALSDGYFAASSLLATAVVEAAAAE